MARHGRAASRCHRRIGSAIERSPIHVRDVAGAGREPEPVTTDDMAPPIVAEVLFTMAPATHVPELGIADALGYCVNNSWPYVDDVVSGSTMMYEYPAPAL